ncbi:MAG: hypothetical protein DRP11_00865 [Candidatus Aenigmatarchaeota archaeon]|nr:MAG: hypothetical protein DRP11_00865 [Candidatus Aenigmarchaeota archaeon]
MKDVIVDIITKTKYDIKSLEYEIFKSEWNENMLNVLRDWVNDFVNSSVEARRYALKIFHILKRYSIVEKLKGTGEGEELPRKIIKFIIEKPDVVFKLPRPAQRIVSDYLEKYLEYEQRKDVDESIISMIVSKEPLYRYYISRLEGFGAVTWGIILSKVKDVTRFPTKSKLLTYLGWSVTRKIINDPETGEVKVIIKAQRKGDPDSKKFDPFIKSQLYLYAQRLNMGKSVYSLYLHRFLDYYSNRAKLKNENVTQSVIRKRAYRKVIKLVVSSIHRVAEMLKYGQCKEPYEVKHGLTNLCIPPLVDKPFVDFWRHPELNVPCKCSYYGSPVCGAVRKINEVLPLQYLNNVKIRLTVY